jgi:multidrug efflux pump
VFVPCAFITGLTGAFFRQFAVTIAASTVISTFNSLTLSPALAAILLRARDKETAPPLPRLIFLPIGGWLAWEYLTPWLEKGLERALQWWPGLETTGFWHALQTCQLWPGLYELVPGFPTGLQLVVPAAAILVGAVIGWFLSRLVNWLLREFFLAFNAGFSQATRGYTWLVGGLLRISVIVLVIYGGLVFLTYYEFTTTKSSFIPNQDMGYLFCSVQLPDSASLERTSKVMQRMRELARATPGVRHATGIAGQSFALGASGSNFGTMFINLKNYADRRDPSLTSDAILNKLRQEFGKIPEAVIQVFGPPPVRGVGMSGGFAVWIEDRGDAGPKALQEQVDNLNRKALMPNPEKTPWLIGPGGKPLLMMFSVFRANIPQLHIDVDRSACMMRGVNLKDFADTLSVYEGSLYVNDFNRFGRTWQVIVQGEDPFRSQVENLSQLKVRNSRGAMVPLGSLATARENTGPLILNRYNTYPAAAINGQAPGVSSSQVRELFGRLSDAELAKANGMTYEWTDMQYLEILQGNTAVWIFALAVVMVFLVLAAQYESWTLPLAVILVVPMCIFSAIRGVVFAGQDINIFTQIGFVVLVGLASKNSILIVEFAKRQRHAGVSRRDATLAACRVRLRPIIMTSLAFVLGVVPMILAHGAGAEMRKMLGTAVFSGMIGVTLFGLVLTPVFFFTIDWLGESRLFASHWMRRIGVLGMDLLTLRPVRRMGRLVIQRMAATPRPTANGQPATTNGDGRLPTLPRPAEPVDQK